MRTTDLYRSDLERHLFTLKGVGAGRAGLSLRLARWMRAAAALLVW